MNETLRLSEKFHPMERMKCTKPTEAFLPQSLSALQLLQVLQLLMTGIILKMDFWPGRRRSKNLKNKCYEKF